MLRAVCRQHSYLGAASGLGWRLRQLIAYLERTGLDYSESEPKSKGISATI
jgi:hypothetical protein